jgi:hypothetical protein
MDTGSPNTDRLLEQDLGGDPPGEIFRARVLLDSSAAFVHARQVRARWRPAALGAAAVVIAGVSFLLGRCCAPQSVVPAAATQTVANVTVTIPVPGELVEWLHAARFFKQLGMEERVALAYDRASKLVPYDSADASGPAGGAYAADASLRRYREGVQPDAERTVGQPNAITKTPHSQTSSAERTQPIIAQSFGG